MSAQPVRITGLAQGSNPSPAFNCVLALRSNCAMPPAASPLAPLAGNDLEVNIGSHPLISCAAEGCRKQAEFLVWKSLDWPLIDGIGALNSQAKATVEAALAEYPTRHHPNVEMKAQWYY